jgi:hypothetical protein
MRTNTRIIDLSRIETLSQRSALLPKIWRCGKIALTLATRKRAVSAHPSGAKARVITSALRGAEAPLFHGRAGFLESSSSLGRCRDARDPSTARLIRFANQRLRSGRGLVWALWGEESACEFVPSAEADLVVSAPDFPGAERAGLLSGAPSGLESFAESCRGIHPHLGAALRPDGPGPPGPFGFAQGRLTNASVPTRSSSQN